MDGRCIVIKWMSASTVATSHATAAVHAQCDDTVCSPESRTLRNGDHLNTATSRRTWNGYQKQIFTYTNRVAVLVDQLDGFVKHVKCVWMWNQRILLLSALWHSRVTVNSSHGQLVTQSTRHRSTRHPVDSSHSWLVTKRRSTRHKQTNKQTSKPYCRSSIITLTRSPRSPPLRKNAQEIEQKNKVNNKAHATLTQNFT